MRILIYSVVVIVLICVVVPLVQAFNEVDDIGLSSEEKILAIEKAENNFLNDYGVHSSEYRNMTFLNDSSDLVILGYIQKEYLVCPNECQQFKWADVDGQIRLICSTVE